MRETSTFQLCKLLPAQLVLEKKQSCNELEMSGSGSNAVAKRPSGGNRWASRRVRALNSL